MKKQVSYTLADMTLEGRGSNAYLDSIGIALDWQAIEQVLAHHYKVGGSATGRPAFQALCLFKMLLLGIWYDLSDRSLEQACSDRISFMRFIGLGLSDQAPDATRLVAFRRLLGTAGMEALLSEVNRQMEYKGVIVKKGVMVDATITLSARKATTQGGGGDGGAGLARKAGGPTRLAYKAHVATDERGLVLGMATSAGNLADCDHLAAALDAAERCSGKLNVGTHIITDRGYFGAAHSQMLKKRGFADGIMGKGQKNKALDALGKERNQALKKVRYVIERTFGSVKSWFGATRTRYLGLAKTHFFHLAWGLCYNLKRLPGLLALKLSAEW